MPTFGSILVHAPCTDSQALILLAHVDLDARTSDDFTIEYPAGMYLTPA